MTDIVFINPPLTLEERYGKLSSGGSLLAPLGLATLAAITRDKGFKAEIIDSAALGLSYEDTVDQIIQRAPKYVGITATTIAIYNAAKLARELKKKRQDIFIIIGGPHVSSIPEDTMSRFPQFDAGVIGEGDVTVIEMLNALQENKDLKRVQGLIIRANGSIERTPGRELIVDLDKLPLPAWDLLPDLTRYYRPAANSFYQLPSTGVVTSRGCPGKCIFCDRTVSGDRLRMYSALYLLKTVKHLYSNYGVRDIIFHDDNFIAFRKRLYELCEMLIKENLKLTWSCTARVDMVTPELLKMMKRSGCWQIAYGIESGDQEILDFLKKGITLKQIKDALRWTKEAGIMNRGYFMIGVPTETVRTIRKTIDFLLELKLDDFHMSMFTPHPGTEISRSISEYGTVDNDWRRFGGWHPVFIPRDLTKEQLIYFHKLAFRKFYFRPRIIFQYLLYISRDFRNISKLFLGGKGLLRYAYGK
ncbi:MAG: radical SAM protein [Candidatus Omnitrophica bacterium]|nr:radical SAM protein [Candidatus Omnitrophota bacterium]MDD5591964.1 radical SAM protein [Candidatus Omnitrophota bacterium]